MFLNILKVLSDLFLTRSFSSFQFLKNFSAYYLSFQNNLHILRYYKDRDRRFVLQDYEGVISNLCFENQEYCFLNHHNISEHLLLTNYCQECHTPTKLPLYLFGYKRDGILCKNYNTHPDQLLLQHPLHNCNHLLWTMNRADSFLFLWPALYKICSKFFVLLLK